jgi:hypothetical protein
MKFRNSINLRRGLRITLSNPRFAEGFYGLVELERFDSKYWLTKIVSQTTQSSWDNGDKLCFSPEVLKKGLGDRLITS